MLCKTGHCGGMERDPEYKSKMESFHDISTVPVSREICNITACLDLDALYLVFSQGINDI
jgi:hypothetical protein